MLCKDLHKKAKIERFWRSTDERFNYTTDLSAVTSLEQFNRMYREYVRDYNTRFHSGIHCTPFERYQSTKDQIRQAKSVDWLNDCFHNRIFRKVRLDSTVAVNNISYDVPMQFIKQKVEIRYIPNDMFSAYILFNGKKYYIRPTNKNENAHTRRNNSPVLDYSRIGEDRHDF